MDQFLDLRPITPADEEFLLQVYESNRQEESASIPWDLRSDRLCRHYRYWEYAFGESASVIQTFFGCDLE